MQNERIKLEQIILGACLLENCYAKVADILNHGNFSKTDFSIGHLMDHQLIFHALEKLYPLKPIDMWTVWHELRHEAGIGYYLAELTSMVSSSANLRYYAFVLLEYNIRSAFIELLQGKISTGGFTTMTVAAIQEIINEALNTDSDVFEIIDASAIHLENIYADESLIAAINEFRNGMDKRIKKIKNQSSIDSLLNNLNNLSMLSHDVRTRMAVDHLTDVLKAILTTGKINQEVAEEIFKIKIH